MNARVIAIAVVILGAAAAGGWYFLKSGADGESKSPLAPLKPAPVSAVPAPDAADDVVVDAFADDSGEVVEDASVVPDTLGDIDETVETSTEEPIDAEEFIDVYGEEGAARINSAPPSPDAVEPEEEDFVDPDLAPADPTE